MLWPCQLLFLKTDFWGVGGKMLKVLMSKIQDGAKLSQTCLYCGRTCTNKPIHPNKLNYGRADKPPSCPPLTAPGIPERLHWKVAIKGVGIYVSSAILLCLGEEYGVVSVHCHSSRECVIQQREPRLLRHVQKMLQNLKSMNGNQI